ncbi:MAG: phospholipase [Muribaculaceae bacterium]|nr:phospholipase [Muribaculaceae bacterium]
MTAALIIASAIILAGLALYVHHRLTSGDDAPALPPVAADEECCGQHAVCERDSLLAAVSQKIEYYDDEELDAFAGRDPESYSAAESEQFRDVLLTLLPDDIAGWARSVQLRGIALPVDVRDELIMMISEARASRTHA